MNKLKDILGIIIYLLIVSVVAFKVLVETIKDTDTGYIRDKKWYDYL